ncbi:SURF1 family protein [Motilibacter aurantiacus]|uniref:SURF1 family protein n=1 Tax=Motilibacter aurantiacus TaxID=2714955 RepID=UPI001407D922|nr:SURF1 family protein [Motilibacter aurantiacus]
MSRRLWTTSALVLHALLAVVLVAFGWLGSWQLERFLDKARGTVVVRDDPAVPLTALARPGQEEVSESALGRLVTVEGEYLPGGQLLLPDRELRGRQGYWLLAPLRAAAGGDVVPVVRGWVESPDAAAADLPSGPVTLTGRVQPAEPVDDVGDEGLPAGQVLAASPVELLATVQAPLYNLLVVAASEAPRVAAAPEPVELWVHRPGGGFPLQNFAYAIQWWVFAAFAVFMWWRFLPEADDSPPAGSRHDSEAGIPAGTTAGDRPAEPLRTSS